jgi:hypothetical protein
MARPLTALSAFPRRAQGATPHGDRQAPMEDHRATRTWQGHQLGPPGAQL